MKYRRTVAPRNVSRPKAEQRAGIHWLLLFALLLAAAYIEVWESTAASDLSLRIDRLQERV